MITDLNKIADEWSYRVGTIKPKDFKHLYHLNQILYEYDIHVLTLLIVFSINGI